MANKTNKISSGSDNDLFKKMEEIKKGGSFLMTVTTLNPKKKSKERLETFLLANNFPSGEIDKTQKMIAKIINGLKKNYM